MKTHERINFLLLGTLWILAIVLMLDFWLNTMYNFNMFSGAHWQYVAQLQATKQPIATGFFVSITLAITACILGLYILFRPRFRKIKIAQPQPKNQVTPVVQQNVATTPVMPQNNIEQHNIEQPKPTINIQPIIQRPPHLHIQPTTFAPKTTSQNQTQPLQQPTNQPNNKLMYTDEMRDIFAKSDYRVLTPKTIKNVPLSLIALGAGETLWLGAVNISHEQMTDVMLAFKSIFQEILDDIDINAFIIKPTDQTGVDAIMDFESIDDLSVAITEQPNDTDPDSSDDESNNMDAFAGYIETVITYLGNK